MPDVYFKLDAITDRLWLDLFNVMLDMTGQKERKKAGSGYAALEVKDYSLSDHQFIQLVLNIPNLKKQVIVHFPRSFVMTIIEGVPHEQVRNKMGF